MQVVDVTNDSSDSKSTDSGVSALFADDDDETDQVCWDCGVTLTPETCYPKGSWGDASELAVRCREHWDKHISPTKAKLQKIQQAHRAKGEQIRAKRKSIEAFASDAESSNNNTKKPKPKSSNSNTKKPKPKSSNNTVLISKYQWVDVRWGDRQFYRAYVFMVNVAAGEPPNYDCYFIEDGEIALGVGVDDIRVCPVDVDSFWATKVDQFVGESFTHDGKGKVRVKGIFRVDEIKGNAYQCTREAQGRKKQISKLFPVSKVVMTLKRERETVREM